MFAISSLYSFSKSGLRPGAGVQAEAGGADRGSSSASPRGEVHGVPEVQQARPELVHPLCSARHPYGSGKSTHASMEARAALTLLRTQYHISRVFRLAMADSLGLCAMTK